MEVVEHYEVQEVPEHPGNAVQQEGSEEQWSSWCELQATCLETLQQYFDKISQ